MNILSKNGVINNIIKLLNLYNNCGGEWQLIVLQEIYKIFIKEMGG